MKKSKWLKILKSGSLIGVVTTTCGAMMGPPVLAVLPTKWAGIMIVAGSLLTAFSQSLPQLILEIMDDNDATLGEGRQSGAGTEVSL